MSLQDALSFIFKLISNGKLNCVLCLKETSLYDNSWPLKNMSHIFSPESPLWVTFSCVLMFYLRLAPPPSAVLSVSPGEGRTGPSLFSSRKRTGSQHTKLWLFLWRWVFPERSWNRIIHTRYLAGGELWRWSKKNKRKNVVEGVNEDSMWWLL